MEKLKLELEDLVKRLPNEAAFRERLSNLVSIYPFSEFEYIISNLLANDVLTLDEYHEVRDSYIARNLYLYVFEIGAPRGFGETWAQGQLKSLVPALEKPSKKLDPFYSGEYDFFLDGKIKIEVKASRVVDSSVDAPLYIKALASDSKRPFWMNFQQIKPACCDVFVWVAVWRDFIRYWVLSSREVQAHPDFSKGQHRGNVGEGQLHIRHDNISDFDSFIVPSDKLAEGIRQAYLRQKS